MYKSIRNTTNKIVLIVIAIVVHRKGDFYESLHCLWFLWTKYFFQRNETAQKTFHIGYDVTHIHSKKYRWNGSSRVKPEPFQLFMIQCDVH